MKILTIAVCALTLFAITSWVAIGVSGARSEEIKTQETLPVMTMEQALKVANDHVPGRVVEAEFEEAGEKVFYEIEVVSSDGIVREVQVDAHTGEIIKHAREGEVSYIPVETAMRIAREYFRWHVVEVGLEENDQQAVYEIELVSYTGETQNIQVDALSGKVMIPESQTPETD